MQILSLQPKLLDGRPTHGKTAEEISRQLEMAKRIAFLNEVLRMALSEPLSLSRLQQTIPFTR